MAAGEQRRSQRVIAQAAAAVHFSRAGREIQQPHLSRALKRTTSVQMLEQIALVRLVPGDGVRLNGSQVQPAHELGFQQASDQRPACRARPITP